MDFESPDEIDRPYKRQGGVAQKKQLEINKDKISPQKGEDVKLSLHLHFSIKLVDLILFL